MSCKFSSILGETFETMGKNILKGDPIYIYVHVYRDICNKIR